MKKIIIPMALIMILGFASCSNEDEGPAVSTIKFAVATTSSNSSSIPNGRIAAANDLIFTGGTITIREVVFDGENISASISESRTIEQVASVDYATGQVSPEIIIEVEPGEYEGVNLGIEMQDDGPSPSTILTGTYTNSENTDIPVRFEFNSGEVFEAEASAATIEAGEDIVGKITFDALDWFSVVSAEQMDEAEIIDGVMIISESINSDIFDLVADRLDVATQAVFE